jgi:voltage-gated potassium channel Kch
VRTFWRSKLRPTWQSARPILILAAAIAVLVLGTAGYMRLRSGAHPLGFFDSFFRSFTLFGLGGFVDPPVPWQLQSARILGPLVTGYAAVRGLIALSRDQFELLGIRLFARDHVVVAGLGTTGARLATGFFAEGRRVVGIEADSSRPSIEHCRDAGVRVVTGDATNMQTLRKARVGRARYFVVTCHDDTTNVDVATAAGALVAGRRGALSAFAHLRDLRLWSLLKAEAVSLMDGPAFRLEFFNVWATAARMILERHPPFPRAVDRDGPDPHLCFVGLDGPGENLILHVAGAWRNDHPRPEARLRVTLAGPDAGRLLDDLLARQPELKDICDLDARPASLDSAAFREGEVLFADSGECTVTKVYVNIADESAAMAAALALHGRPETCEVPIVVTVSDDNAGVGKMLQPDEGRFRCVVPFGVFSEALTPVIVLRGMNEALAQARHAAYVAVERAKDVTPQQDRRVVAWDGLSEDDKNEYRMWADGLGEDLAAGGFAVMPAPLIDAEDPLLTLTEPEVDILARVDHARQVESAGGANPLTDAWDTLGTAEKELERSAVRELPRILAHVGFELYRRDGKGLEQALPGPTGAGLAVFRVAGNGGGRHRSRR